MIELLFKDAHTPMYVVGWWKLLLIRLQPWKYRKLSPHIWVKR